MLVNGLDNRLTEEQAVVVEGRERQAGREQTGEVCDVQVDDMGERQTGGTEGVMEQEFALLPKKRRSSKQSDDVGAKVSRRTGRSAESSDSSEGEGCVSDNSNLSQTVSQKAKGAK